MMTEPKSPLRMIATLTLASFAVASLAADSAEDDDRSSVPRTGVEQSQSLDLTVDGTLHCRFVGSTIKNDDAAAQLSLEPNHRYIVRVLGGVSHKSGKLSVPLSVLTPDAENGRELQTITAHSGNSFTFTTGPSADSNLRLQAFVTRPPQAKLLDGQFLLKIESCPLAHFDSERLSAPAAQLININFGRAPMGATCDSVIGGDFDFWNFVDHGETRIEGVRYANGTPSDVTIDISPNDGEWGIRGHTGVYHAYIYHNARNVDISATINHLPSGYYEAYVMAHGDAIDQNADVEIQSGNRLYSGQSTTDESEDYRSHVLLMGRQYVKYIIRVQEQSPVIITSRRSASTLAMLNAIQLRRIKSFGDRQ